MTVRSSAAAMPAPGRIEPPSLQLRRNLRAMTGDGVAFSLMVGAGETYLPAFALALGLGEVAAGLVAAVPLLAGAVLQLAGPWAVRRLRSHRRWVLLCAAVQAASFAPLVAAALSGSMSRVWLFVVATVYWGAGLGTGPAWNTWVATLVPARMRPSFFTYRSRLAQGAVLAGVVCGGAALHVGEEHARVFSVFAGLFFVAGLCRLVSVAFLTRQTEPEPLPPSQRGVGLRELVAKARRANDGRLLLYMLVVQIAVQLSGPFFTPFMLEELRFTYGSYLMLISTSFAAKMVALPLLGTVANRFGAQRLLYASGVGIVPLAALWIVSDNLWYLLAVQVVAGTTWAGYELATFLLLFEHIDQSQRTSILTLFNLANAVATVAGAVTGGVILNALGEDRGAYLGLFAISSASRVLSIALLATLGRMEAEPATVVVRALAARPNTGSVDAPIVASLPDATEEPPEAPAVPGGGGR
jgi:MFS family permease